VPKAQHRQRVTPAPRHATPRRARLSSRALGSAGAPAPRHASPRRAHARRPAPAPAAGRPRVALQAPPIAARSAAPAALPAAGGYDIPPPRAASRFGGLYTPWSGGASTVVWIALALAAMGTVALLQLVRAAPGGPGRLRRDVAQELKGLLMPWRR
jgi:hypothetical protein